MAGRILYQIARFLIFFFARFIFRLRVSGVENLPSSGGFIIASNHLSYLDIPLLGYSLGRPAHYIAKKELFTIPVAGAILRLLGGIPIDRERIDRSSVKMIIKRLNDGNIVVIYPEGTRSIDGRLQPGKPGVGFMARMSGRQVVPAAITGTDRAMPSGSWIPRPYPVTITFGKPLDFSNKQSSLTDRGGDARITKSIMDNISVLLEAERE